jgi:hypothetical protein
MLAVVTIVVLVWPFEQAIESRHKTKKRQAAFDQFHAALMPIFRADERFDYVFCQRFTGGERGALLGEVFSTNDLESVRQIFLATKSNHPASVSFNVELKILH